MATALGTRSPEESEYDGILARAARAVELERVGDLIASVASCAHALGARIPMDDVADLVLMSCILERVLICGTQHAVNQALAMGHTRDRIFRNSGMVLHPRFYAAPSEDQASIRTRLGLHPNLTTVLVMFGGQGSREMLETANAFNNCSSRFQVVYVCGRNESLRRELERLESRPRRIITLAPQIDDLRHTCIGLFPIMWATDSGADVMKPIAAPMAFSPRYTGSLPCFSGRQFNSW